MKIYITVILVGCFLAGSSSARIYRCLGESDVYEFRDRFCDASEESVIVPKNYPLTYQNQSNTKQKKTFKKKRIVVAKSRKQSMAKTERLTQRCTQTKQKIKTIKRKLRVGCKIAQCDRLKDKLTHFQHMEKRYCVSK